MKFDYIVSLGFFCGVAQELERKGFREKSFPFDWVISNLKTVNDLIENKFNGLFDLNYLYKNEEFTDEVKHKKYIFNFYHDFDKNKTIEKQIDKVQLKYERRIKRFYNLLNSSHAVLFVCYINDADPIGNVDMPNQIIKLVNLLNQYKLNYKIIFIKNRELILNSVSDDEHILIFDTEKDNNDSVNKKFIKTTFEINRYFKSQVEYDGIKKIRNLLYFYKKELKKNLFKIYRKFLKKFSKNKSIINS